MPEFVKDQFVEKSLHVFEFISNCAFASRLIFEAYSENHTKIL